MFNTPDRLAVDGGGGADGAKLLSPSSAAANGSWLVVTDVAPAIWCFGRNRPELEPSNNKRSKPITMFRSRQCISPYSLRLAASWWVRPPNRSGLECVTKHSNQLVAAAAAAAGGVDHHADVRAFAPAGWIQALFQHTLSAFDVCVWDVFRVY